MNPSQIKLNPVVSSSFTGSLIARPSSCLLSAICISVALSSSQYAQAVDYEWDVNGEYLHVGDLEFGTGLSDETLMRLGGDSATSGVLKINGNLTLREGFVIDYSYGPTNTPGEMVMDVIEINGDFTLQETVDDDWDGIFINVPDILPMYGVYRIISYTGSLDRENGMYMLSSNYEYFLGHVVDHKISIFTSDPFSSRPPILFWDTGEGLDGRIDGGSGFWSNGTMFTTGNSENEFAYSPVFFTVFDDFGGTVKVDDEDGDILTSGMQFAVDGYNVEDDKLTLFEFDTGSGQAVIRVGDGTAAGADMTAVIDSELAGTAGFIKEDLGTLVLNGINTFTGNTTVNGGELHIYNGSALSDTGNVTVNNFGDLHVFDDETIGSLTGVGPVNLNDGSDLTIGGDADDLTESAYVYAGIINDGGSGGGVVKEGNDRMILTGDGSAFTNLTVNEGTLQIGSGDPDAITTSSVTVGNFTQGVDGNLAFDGLNPAMPLTVTGVAAYAGDIEVLNLDTLRASTKKVLIDVQGGSGGAFNQAENAVIFSGRDFDFHLSYLMGDGDDVGMFGVLAPGSTLRDVVPDMMRSSQESSLGQLDDLEDRIMLHRRIGFYEDRKASTIGTAQNSVNNVGTVGSLKNGSYYGTVGFGDFGADNGLTGQTARSQAGYENKVNPDLWLGWQISYGNTQWQNSGSEGELAAYRLSFYGSWTMKPNMFLDAGISAGRLDFETTRDGGWQKGEANGMDIQSFARVVWRVIDQEGENGFVRLSPYVGVRGVWTDIGEYEEIGNSVSAQSAVLAQIYTGVDWSEWYDVGYGRGWGYHARLQAFVSDSQAMDDPVEQSTQTTLFSSHNDRWGARASLGADYCFGDWTLSGEASVTQSQNSDNWQTKLSLTRWW